MSDKLGQCLAYSSEEMKIMLDQIIALTAENERLVTKLSGRTYYHSDAAVEELAERYEKALTAIAKGKGGDREFASFLAKQALKGK